MDTETTNSVGGEDTGAPILDAEAGVEPQSEAEILYDDEGNPVEEPEDEEVELDDEVKLKVPKDHAQKVREAMLRQADYTRKTQELAEARKAFAAETDTFRQASEAELNTFATLTNLQGQIAQYQRIDWAAWHDQDPFAAARATSEYNIVRDAYQQAQFQLAGLRQQRLSVAQQEIAKRTEEGRAALTREIPGWNNDLKAKLTDFAADFGFSRDEIDDLEADPRVAKVLHAAFKGSEAVRKAQRAQTHVDAQQAQPAAKVGARSAPPAGLDDRLSTSEWVKRREAQVRKRAQGL